MRITELPQTASVAQTDDLAIDVPGGKTYRVPRSILAPAPYIATIPTGQWSGSGSDRYITVTASNVTANAMLYPFYDNASAALLNGPVWVIPAEGSFTIHTSAIPSGTVTISVLLAGIVGEAQYQVLADVYSKSQVDSIVAQSTAAVAHGTNVASGSTYSFTAEVHKPLLIIMGRGASSKKGMAMYDYWGTLTQLIEFSGATISANNGTITIVNTNVTSGAVTLMVYELPGFAL